MQLWELQVVVVWIIVHGVIGYCIGKRKAQTVLGILVSVLFGPVGWVLAALLPNLQRKCPSCAEPIDDAADICPRCQSNVSQSLVAPRQRLSVRRVALVAIAVAVLAIVLYLMDPERVQNRTADAPQPNDAASEAGGDGARGR